MNMLYIYTWAFGSITTCVLLIERIKPSDNISELLYTMGICTAANSLLLLATGTCLGSLGA